GEKRALLRVFEELPHLAGKCDRSCEMIRIEVSFIQIEQCGNEERIVIEEAVNGGLAFAKAALQSAVSRIVHAGEDELSSSLGGGKIARLVQNLGGLGEGRDHMGVPGRENLVVQMRADAFRSDREQLGPGFGELRGDGRLGYLA